MFKSCLPDDEHQPDPYFDPAEFFCAGSDYERAAAHLSEGDSYRKSLLALDAAGEAELGRHLAARGLALHDDVTHWLVIAADEPPKPPVPAQPQGWATCVRCGRPIGSQERGVWRLEGGYHMECEPTGDSK